MQQRSTTGTITDVEERNTDWVITYNSNLCISVAKVECPWMPVAGQTITVATVNNEVTSVTISGVTVR